MEAMVICAHKSTKLAQREKPPRISDYLVITAP